MPGGTTSKKISSRRTLTYYCVYVLESCKDNKRYIGFTTHLQKRMKDHNDGKVFSTKPRKPFKLIYAELCVNPEDAKRREKYLKTTDGRRFLAKRLKTYYS